MNQTSTPPDDTSTYLTHTEPQPDSDTLPPDHIGVLIAAALMALGGWWGLYVVVTSTLPRVGPRWVFFMLLHISITGSALPIVRFLNARFTPIGRELVSGGVLVRQSTWVGLYITTCAWLQVQRVLSWSIAFFMSIVFIVLEAFMRSRERSLEEDDDNI